MGFYEGDNPCRNCVAPKRHPGCHGACEEHAAWKEKVNEKKNQYINGSKQDHLMMSVEKRRAVRIRKRKWGK